MNGLIQKLKEWMLPVAMLTGVSSYLVYNALPQQFHQAGPILSDIVAILQPLMIFAMLLLTFCRIEPRDLKPHRWHWWLLLIQGGLFTLLGAAAYAVINLLPGEHHGLTVLIESAMLCLICPTATAAAVVTRKLGGDVAGITTYVILINILAAVLIPFVVPLVMQSDGPDFWTTFSMITAKVFPLLITPCLCAWLIRYLFPHLHGWLLRFPDLPFYIWAAALTLAMALTARSIIHSDMAPMMLVGMSAVSLACCVFQFAAGRAIGGRYINADGMTQKVTAGQSIGQKNTIFAIWLAVTFMTPETAIVGGFYSIWHNIYNSWQLASR